MSERTGRTTGPWGDRVVFSPEGGGVAYRAREVVRAADAERTQQFLRRVHTRATGSFLNYETDNDSVAAVHDLQL